MTARACKPAVDRGQSAGCGFTAEHRFAVLDAFRGICASIVVLHHYAPRSGSIGSANLVEHGFFFVDFFFVLSGFVIFHNYRDRIASSLDVVLFVWRRFSRLWPLHALVLLALVGAEIARWGVGSIFGAVAPPFSGHYNLADFPIQLLFLEGININRVPTWNEPSWSISAEFQVGICFALCALICRRTKRTGVSMFSLSVGVVIVGTLVILLLSKPYMNAAREFGTVRCLVDFCSGIIAYQCSVRLKGKLAALNRTLATILELMAAVGVFWFVSSIGNEPQSCFAPAIFGMAVLLLSAERGLLSALCQFRWLQLLGAWSYSIYMLQAPVAMLTYYLRRFAQKIGASVQGWGEVPERFIPQLSEMLPDWIWSDIQGVCLLLTVFGAAAMSFMYFETPIKNRLYVWGSKERLGLAMGRLKRPLGI